MTLRCWHRGPPRGCTQGGLPAMRLRISWRRLAAGVYWFRSGQRRSSLAHSRLDQCHVLPIWPTGSCGKGSGSRSNPFGLSGLANEALRRWSLQFQQAGVSMVRVQETRCREQVTSSSSGFWVFAAAADKAGQGGVELRIRQDIMGDDSSFHVLVAELRFLLIRGAAAGVIQLCVRDTHPTARVAKPRYRHGGAVPRRSSEAASLPSVLPFDANVPGVDCVAGHWRQDRGLGGYSWRGISCTASGMGLSLSSDDAILAPWGAHC